MRDFLWLSARGLVLAFMVVLGAACGPATPLPTLTPTPTFTPTASDATPETPAPPPSATLPPPTAPPTPERDTLDEALDVLESQVRMLRGLTDAPLVSRQRVTADVLRQRLAEQEARLGCPLPDTFAWQALGLWPSDEGEITAEVFADTPPPLAFFDLEDTVIYYTAEAITPALELAYVRAYAQALLWQAHPLPRAENSDQCLAQQALLQGTTTYMEYLWFFSYASPAAATEAAAETPPQWPLAVQKYRDFPADAGFGFVFALSQENGWESITRAFAAPPTSTEQIMYPAHYPADTPQDMTLPAAAVLTQALGEGWEVRGQDVLGDALLYLMLTANVNPEARLMADDAANATEGWGGGAWVLLHNPETGGTALLADVTWDTGSDAVAFVKAFVRYARGRFGPLNDRAYRALYWETDAQAAVLRYNSGLRRTVWAFAPTRAQAEALLAAAQAPGTGGD